MRMKILSATALLAFASTTQAASPNYSYIEGSFGELDGDASAVYVGGSMALDRKLAFVGALGVTDYDIGNGLVVRGGGLYRKSLQRELDVYGSLELVYSDYDYRWPGIGAGTWASGSDQDIGLVATVGMRWMLQDNFEVAGKLTLTEVDPFEDGLGLGVSARYYLDRQLSAAAGIASDTEFDGIFVNLRYDLK